MILFLIYLILLVYFLFFSEALGRDINNNLPRYNIYLFKEIRRFYIYRKKLGFYAFSLNIFGNILAFIPFGIFRPIIGIRKHSFLRTCFQGLLFSFFIELTQLRFKVGCFDVDDIFLNTLGCILGYTIFLIFYKTYAKYNYKKNMMR